MYRISFLFLLTICLNGTFGHTLLAQDSLAQKTVLEIVIPEEILGRIPGDQLATFLLSRERVLKDFPEKIIIDDAFAEIGVSKEAIARIPGDQLFQFLEKRGYVEVGPGEHIVPHDAPGAPSPKQIISILIILLAIFSAVLMLSLVLAHQRKVMNQQIVIEALQSGSRIPLDVLNSNRRRSNFTNALIFFFTGLGIVFAGTFDILPPALGIIPIGIGIGFFFAGLLIKD